MWREKIYVPVGVARQLLGGRIIRQLALRTCGQRAGRKGSFRLAARRTVVVPNSAAGHRDDGVLALVQLSALHLC